MKKNKEVQKELFLKYLNYIKEIRLYKKDMEKFLEFLTPQNPWFFRL